ncbi:MAG: PorT family protein [Chitinophagales bacterium]|nr:PorT family protein [Chitinophagales bacterium]
MKKIIIAFAFLLFITNSFGQYKKFRFGLQLTNGVSFINSDNVNISDTKSGYAFSYGLLTEYSFNENYAISTGVNISNPRVSRANSPAINAYYLGVNDTVRTALGLLTDQKESYTFTYIDLPLVLKLITKEIGYFRYFGEFGIVNSFRVRSRFTLDGSSLENKSINKKLSPFDIRSNFYNASLKVGGGFEYIISDKTTFLVELSFNNGFINILDDGDDKRSVLRMVNLTTGIMF